MTLTRLNELIGRRIERVFHVDLGRSEDGFQERKVLVELDGGQIVDLDQQTGTPLRSNGEVVYYADRPPNATIVLSGEDNPELCCPISGVFVPFEWETSIGLQMNNGFVVHNGFSQHGNGAMLYRPAASTLTEFTFIAGKAR